MTSTGKQLSAEPLGSDHTRTEYSPIIMNDRNPPRFRLDPFHLETRSTFSARPQSARLFNNNGAHIVDCWCPLSAYLRRHDFGANLQHTRQDINCCLWSRARIPVQSQRFINRHRGSLCVHSPVVGFIGTSNDNIPTSTRDHICPDFI